MGRWCLIEGLFKWVWKDEEQFTWQRSNHEDHIQNPNVVLWGGCCGEFRTPGTKLVRRVLKNEARGVGRPDQDQPRQCIKNQRHHLADKGSFSQSYGFSSRHVRMWELDHKGVWAPKNWCFWTVVLEKTLESPLDCKEIKPVHPKGNQPWTFIGRTDAEAEASKLWPPDAKNGLIGKDPDAGKDWGQEEKGKTEDDMAGWHHWLNGHEFE